MYTNWKDELSWNAQETSIFKYRIISSDIFYSSSRLTIWNNGRNTWHSSKCSSVQFCIRPYGWFVFVFFLFLIIWISKTWVFHNAKAYNMNNDDDEWVWVVGVHFALCILCKSYTNNDASVYRSINTYFSLVACWFSECGVNHEMSQQQKKPLTLNY